MRFANALTFAAANGLGILAMMSPRLAGALSSAGFSRAAAVCTAGPAELEFTPRPVALKTGMLVRSRSADVEVAPAATGPKGWIGTSDIEPVAPFVIRKADER